MPRRLVRIVTWPALALCLLLGGCSALPSAGPLASDVDSNAGFKVPYAAKGYLLIDVTPQVIDILNAEPVAPELPADFGAVSPAKAAVIGVGDGVTVGIWEAGAGGLFTSAPENQFVSGARSVTIPEQIVSAQGDIAIPYAGRVVVAGLSTGQAEEQIRKRLTGKAIEPQVTVSLSHNSSNAVSVIGEVGTGGRIPLGPQGLKVLDAIALAGGDRIPENEALVRLARGGQTANLPLTNLMEHPQLNIFLQAGDIVSVVRQPKTFTAFGATGHNQIVPFDTVNLTLDEAVAKAGGLLDERADSSGVYLFRFEPASVAAQLAPSQISADMVAADAPIPVVFRLDMNSVLTYFRSRQIAMHDKDIIYVADARLSQVQKFLALVNAVISPAITGATISTSVK